MKNIALTLSVAWKEIQVLLRDRGALALLILFPILLSSVQGGANVAVAAEGETPSILLHVGLVNEDEGNFGSEISKALRSIDILEIKVFEQTADAEGSVAKGKAAASIVIPWFADRYAEGRDWRDLAWWLHDHLDYSEIWFFPKLCAFNLVWRPNPLRRIDSYIAPRGCLLAPGAEPEEPLAARRRRYADFPRFRGIRYP